MHHFRKKKLEFLRISKIIVQIRWNCFELLRILNSLEVFGILLIFWKLRKIHQNSLNFLRILSNLLYVFECSENFFNFLKIPSNSFGWMSKNSVNYYNNYEGDNSLGCKQFVYLSGLSRRPSSTSLVNLQFAT